jgi:hypothetical protein
MSSQYGKTEFDMDFDILTSGKSSKSDQFLYGKEEFQIDFDLLTAKTQSGKLNGNQHKVKIQQTFR